jgi:hypothetical protein
MPPLYDPMAVQPQGVDPANVGLNVNQTAGDDMAEAKFNQQVGEVAGWAAVGMSAVAGFFSAQTKQQTLKTQALQAEFAGTQADLQARDYEDQALAIISSGNAEISRRGMQAGQERGRQLVNSARRGVRISAGSSAEVRASMELVRQMEARTIRTNVRRQAQQARRAALNARLKAAAARGTAANLRGAAKAISPALVALGGAAQTGMQISSAFIK